MKFLNFLFLLAVAGACVYFYLDDKKTSKENTPQQAAPSAPGNTATPKKAPPLRPLPPVTVCDPSPDSLIGKLKAIQRPELIKHTPKGNLKCDGLNGFFSIRQGVTNQKDAKQLLAQMEKVFESYRELNKCTTFGSQSTGDPRQLLPHYYDIRLAISDLLISAEYHFLRGNKKQGLQNIETALHLINIICKGATIPLDFWLSLEHSRNVVTVIKRIKLSAKEKQRLLKKLPGREQYAAALPSVQENEKKTLLFLREWAPELEHEAIENAIKAKLPGNTPPEAAAEVRKQIAEKVKKDIGKEYENGKKLKEIPVEKLEKIYADFAAFALKGFKENTLTKETKYTTGSAEDDKFFALMDQFSLQVFVCSLSARLDAFEKSLNLKK